MHSCREISNDTKVKEFNATSAHAEDNNRSKKNRSGFVEGEKIERIGTGRTPGAYGTPQPHTPRGSGLLKKNRGEGPNHRGQKNSIKKETSDNERLPWEPKN